VAAERRMRWDLLAHLLDADELLETGGASETRSPGGFARSARLDELEARAQWLEDELASAREQFRLETSRNLLARKPPSPEGAHASPPEAEKVLSLLALSANLLRATTELLSLRSNIDPATLETIREVQRRAGKLAGALGTQQEPSRAEGAPPVLPEPKAPPEP
jgi:hypothetical protein